MSEFWIFLLSGVIGALGFAILFRTGITELCFSLGGTILTVLVYLGSAAFFGSHLFLSNFLASAMAGLFAVLAARIIRTPSTVILTPELIPLVPGSSLYYGISAFVSRQYRVGVEYLRSTLEVALGIAVGIVVVGFVDYCFIRICDGIRPSKR